MPRSGAAVKRPKKSLEIDTLNHCAIEFNVSIMECLNDSMTESLCYNHLRPGWRYRLGVRTEDSQSSNPGSIPGSATLPLLLSSAVSGLSVRIQDTSKTRRRTSCGTVAAKRRHNLGHSAGDRG